jgi:hypothetical protein
MRTCFILAFIFTIQYSFSQDSVSIKRYSIGSDTLTFHQVIYYPHSPSVSFVNLHDDENTSVEAGIDFLSRYGGSLLQLQHSGKRHFKFMLNGQPFAFDPNRIFTNKGIRETLEKQNIYREDAAAEVKKIADSLLINYVDNKKLVIALHNNTERGLSILSYRKGGFEFKNAARVYINGSMNPHDFILTTDAHIFHYLKRRKINVVLQRHNPGDDGSLSVYAAKKKIRYVNIEALHGHFDEQLQMLETLKGIIDQY